MENRKCIFNGNNYRQTVNRTPTTSFNRTLFNNTNMMNNNNKHKTPITPNRSINVLTNHHHHHHHHQELFTSSSSKLQQRSNYHDMPITIAYEYIDGYLCDAEIDFNLYQFSQRPIFSKFVSLVSLCFSSISKQTMLLNERTTIDDLWRKLNSHFEILLLNIRVHRNDLKLMGQNELLTNNVVKTFSHFIDKRLHLIMKSIKELDQFIIEKNIIHSKIDHDINIEYPELEFFKLSTNYIDIDYTKLTLLDDNINRKFEEFDLKMSNINEIHGNEMELEKLNVDVLLIENNINLLTDKINNTKVIKNSIIDNYQKIYQQLIKFKQNLIKKNLLKIKNKLSNSSIGIFDNDLDLLINTLDNDELTDDDDLKNITNNIEQKINEMIDNEKKKNQELTNELKKLDDESNRQIDEMNKNSTNINHDNQPQQSSSTNGNNNNNNNNTKIKTKIGLR